MTLPADIPDSRRSEYDGLVGLLLDFSIPGDEQAVEIADRVARGCLIDGHLWCAMQLGSRAELRELLENHFPELSGGNTKDMRWKKYLYKRLCGWPDFEG